MYCIYMSELTNTYIHIYIHYGQIRTHIDVPGTQQGSENHLSVSITFVCFPMLGDGQMTWKTMYVGQLNAFQLCESFLSRAQFPAAGSVALTWT